MAGLFDTITDPVAAVKIAEAQRDAQQQQELLQSLRRGFTPAGQAGLSIGSAFGAAFGKKLTERLGLETDSEEMKAAKRQAEIVRALQSADLSTSEGVRAAAAQARALGDDVTALKLVERAAALKSQEAKALRETEAADVEAKRKAFSALPSASQMAMVAEDATVLKNNFPWLDDKQITAIQEQTKTSLETMQLKNAKALQDLKPAIQTNITKGDTDQVRGLLAEYGVGAHSFEGAFGRDNDKAFGDFSVNLAHRAQAIIDKAARQSIRLDMPTVLQSFMTKLEAGGAIDRAEPDDVTGIDLTKLQKIVPDVENELLGMEPAADQPPGTPKQAGRRRITLQ